MYRVCVFSSGKYHNVTKANRYCFFRKSALHLANLFAEFECDLRVEKLAHAGDCFFWTDAEEDTMIWAQEDENENIFYRIPTRKERKEMWK